jgi:hypothetical protein
MRIPATQRNDFATAAGLRLRCFLGGVKVKGTGFSPCIKPASNVEL